MPCATTTPTKQGVVS